eukprot:1179134-Prorocentrum_minimum.AAC.2
MRKLPLFDGVSLSPQFFVSLALSLETHLCAPMEVAPGPAFRVSLCSICVTTISALGNGKVRNNKSIQPPPSRAIRLSYTFPRHDPLFQLDAKSLGRFSERSLKSLASFFA